MQAGTLKNCPDCREIVCECPRIIGKLTKKHMTKFKVGDKVKVKENFWEIKNSVHANDSMKKLAGRTLEVESVHSTGKVYTKQDDSNDDTYWAWHKNWIEPYNPTITWDTLKWKDVVVDEDDDEQMVLGVLNDSVLLSGCDDFNIAGSWYHKEELQERGFTIKQASVDKLELTLEQVAEKFGIEVGNLKIKNKDI